MLDSYLFGDAERISPEAPVPVVDALWEKQTPGGAANVAANIVAAGAKAVLFSVIGEDEAGEKLREITQGAGVETALIQDSSRRTTVKTRVIARNQQVIRIDQETRKALEPDLANKLLESVLSQNLNGLIIEDYDKGVLQPWLISRLIGAKPGGFVAADPKIAHFSLFQGVDLFKPNKKEFLKNFGCQQEMAECISRAAQDMHIRCFLLTMGDEGALLRCSDGLFHVPAMKQEVFDVTGAGDTVIAYATLGMASGLEPVDAAAMASLAAGIKVGKLGASAISSREILERSEEFNQIKEQIRRLA